MLESTSLLVGFTHSPAFHGVLGGLIIGLAAAFMLLGLGRIAGVSGLAARSVGFAAEPPWALATAFILGLPLGAWLMVMASGGVELRFPGASMLLIVGGLLVGFGTRLGGGCTSGHGVCGLSRLSPRSMVATGCFMVAGFATVGIWRAAGWSW